MIDGGYNPLLHMLMVRTQHFDIDKHFHQPGVVGSRLLHLSPVRTDLDGGGEPGGELCTLAQPLP